MLDFALSFHTALLHDQVAFVNFLLKLLLLLVVRLDQAQQISLLMALDICHKKLILILKVIKLVFEA